MGRPGQSCYDTGARRAARAARTVQDPPPAMPDRANLPPLLRVFTYRQYALFMGGMTPNLVTLWMQRVGVGWLTWELTHSPTWLGIMAAADLAPVMFIAPIAGAYTDRTDPVRQQIWMQWLNVIQASGLAAFVIFDVGNIWVLFALALFYGCVHPFVSTSRHAIVPRTVPRAEFATAIALDSALFNASRFVGPAIGAVMIGWWGIESTFIANALTCVWFIALLSFMRLDLPARESRGHRRILGDVADSFAYVRAHAAIGPMFVLLTAVSILLRPVQDMLPGFAGAVFDAGPQGLAWLTASMGVGAMVSAFWIAARGRIGGLTGIVLAGGLGLALATLGFVATQELWIALLFGAASGFALNTMSTGTQALTQSALSDELRGRVMGLYTVIYRGTPAIGALGLGGLAEWFGLRGVFAGAALGCLAALAWIWPRRRTMAAAAEAERPADL